jgi:hypothetical protein
MIGAFESVATALFHQDINSAQGAAVQEAAITGGLVQEVSSINISSDRIHFIGKVGRGNLISVVSNIGDIETPYVEIIANAIGNFHTTWQNILDKVSPIGLLVFMSPLRLIYEGILYDYDYLSNDIIVVNIGSERLGKSLRHETVGEILCANCGKAIDSKRLSAIPNTRHCTHCKKFIEDGG